MQAIVNRFIPIEVGEHNLRNQDRTTQLTQHSDKVLRYQYHRSSLLPDQQNALLRRPTFDGSVQSAVCLRC